MFIQIKITIFAKNIKHTYIMLEIYFLGVIIATILIMINFIIYIKLYKIKYPTSIFYLNDVFTQLFTIAIASWVGVIMTIISIINLLKDNNE